MATKKKELEIPAKGGLQRVRCVAEGAAPLLMNAMPADVLWGLFTKNKPTFVAKDKTPREVAERALYELEDGRYHIPVQNLMACLIAAGVFFKLDGKRQISTKDSTLLPGFVSIEELELPILHPDTMEPMKEWEVDMRLGRNPNGGEAVCIIRPRFDRWAIDFHLIIDVGQIEEHRIRNLVDTAGKRIGLCDFRPQRKGTFGKYNIALWKREDMAAIQEAAE